MRKYERKGEKKIKKFHHHTYVSWCFIESFCFSSQSAAYSVNGANTDNPHVAIRLRQYTGQNKYFFYFSSLHLFHRYSLRSKM